MNHSYKQLLAGRGFQCFLWTQFLGALNDNVFKMITSVTAVSWAASKSSSSCPTIRRYSDLPMRAPRVGS